MDSPLSDESSEVSFEPSPASTPGTPFEPFAPIFQVKVYNPVKDGEFVRFKVLSFRLDDKNKAYRVTRRFEDFEWLHHLLYTQNNISGIIVPPLPYKPVVEAKGAASKSRQQLGSSSNLVIKDEFINDCRGLEKYLRLLITHWLFGKDRNLEKFLTESEPPVRSTVKKGMFTKWSSALSETRKSNHRDIDDYFQVEREWTNHYALLLQQASNNFNKTVYSNKRVVNSYTEISTALSLIGSNEFKHNENAKRVLVKFSEVLNDAKHGSEVDISNDERTLGFHLDLCARYAEALKDMLYRRTCLLVEYEDANKTLAKAKPHKRQEAQDVKVKTEKALEECSEIARREITAFRRQQLLLFQEALSIYAEAKVKTARDTYALLTKSLANIKQLDI